VREGSVRPDRPCATHGLLRLWSARIDDRPGTVAWSPDGLSLATAALSGVIHVYDAASGEEYASLAGHLRGTTSLAWSADAELFASAGLDGTVRHWDLVRCSEREIVDAGAARVDHLSFPARGSQSRGEYFLAAAAGTFVRLWNARGRLLRTYGPHAGTVSALAWKAGTDEFVSAAADEIETWRACAERPVRRLRQKSGSIVAMACSPNGRHIATAHADATVRLCDQRGVDDVEFPGYRTIVRHLSWDADGRYLATADETAVTVWHCAGLPAVSVPRRLLGHQAPANALKYQPSGQLLATADEDGLLLIWEPARDALPVALCRLDTAVVALAWSRDGVFLAAATASGAIHTFAAPSQN
jgi:WD40 repeat protein